MRGWPLRAWAYAASVAGAAVAVTVMLVASSDHFDGRRAIGFGLLVLLAELAPVQLAHVSYSVSFVVVVAAVITLGPAEAAVAASFAAIDLELRTRPDWLGRMIFNGSHFALTSGLCALAYGVLGGPSGDISFTDFPGILLPVGASTVVFFGLNAFLVGAMVAIARGVPARDVWRTNYLSVAVTYFSFAALGLLLAVLFMEMGWGSVLFLLTPLLVARTAFATSVKMQKAYDETVLSLVAAIEAKDPYTRGHAERVARLTEMTAREYGLPADRARLIYYAAIMHDVGKLIVSTRILQKPGKLTAEEFEHMKAHPGFGEQIVAEIELLRYVIDGVRHHHERMDGKGYPDGLVGEEIPLVARLIMVCDAFDSMTSTRSYRMAKPVEDAFGELRRCSGTQFDPACIEALERAVARNGWEPNAEDYEGEQTPRPEADVHAEHAAAPPAAAVAPATS